MIRPPPRSTRTDTLFPYTTLFRSIRHKVAGDLGPVPQDYPFDRFCAGVDIYSLRHTLQLAGGKIPADLAIRCFVARTSEINVRHCRLGRSEGRRVGKECVRTC